MDFGRKRGRPQRPFSASGDFKRSKEEMDSYTTGVGSKSKPCTKFYSTSGCSYGDACHFQHHVPGYNAHIQLANAGGNNSNFPPSNFHVGKNTDFTDRPAPTMKTKLCSKVNTPEGCRFGEKCRFAHSELDIGRPANSGYEDPGHMGPIHGLSQPLGFGNFGASATAKISIDASFAGPIIGKNGVNSKQICRQTGAKLSIKDHETDPNQRNIELEGTFDQIKEASSMVRQLMMNITAAQPDKPTGSFSQRSKGAPPSHFKKKMCGNFQKGSCTFGERCHFAHSANELHNPLA